jgi:hypothetical protein
MLRVPRVDATSISALLAYSGGSASPAGEEVAADRPAVADLGRADRARRDGQPRQHVAQLRDRARVCDAGADAQHAVVTVVLGQGGHPREVEDRLRAGASEVHLHHHVGPAPQRHGLGVSRLGLEGLLPRGRLQELHPGSLCPWY